MSEQNAIVNELQKRVAAARQAGRYPVGLEQQLEADFKAIMDVVHRSGDQLETVRGELHELRVKADNLNGLVSPRSRIPGGSIYHRIVGRLVGHHTRGVAHQAQDTVRASIKVSESLLELLEAQQIDDRRLLRELNHAIKDRLVMVDVLAEAILELERKTK